jgi:hypothetical protein
MSGHGTALIRKRHIDPGQVEPVHVGARIATQNSMLSLPSSPICGS